MRPKIYLLPTVFLLSLLTSCKNGDESSIGLDRPMEILPVDSSTACISGQEAGPYQRFYRPQQGFVGDPMPYYNANDNKFYLFYLYENANRHPIYSTRTSDYGTFEGYTEVLSSGAVGSQDEWIGTGSFIKKGTLYYCFYTGHNNVFTPAEKIMLATSTDLMNWTKQPAMALQAAAGYDQNNFRDPQVYWDEGRNAYVMLVTTRKDGKGTLARYQSTDLSSWSMIEPLVATTGTVEKYGIETDAELLECPDLFKMGNKWYLLFSRINRDEHRKTFYRVADSPDGPWTICRDSEGHHETFDGRYLYAGKTASDGTTRYLSGWCSTGQTVNNNNELPWAGNLISHQLVQGASGRLYPKIPEALNSKFNKEVAFEKLSNVGQVSESNKTYSLTAQSGGRSYVQFNRNTSSVKVTMTIDASQSSKFGFSFGACNDPTEVYSIAFDLTSSNRWNMPALFMNKEARDGGGSKTELNFTPLTVPTNRIFNVKIIIEKSIGIVYVNDRVAFTNRIYKMDQNPWTIFADQGTVQVNGLKIEKSS
ncbi:glycoside hydrolase domain-containing protein [Sphingobacterium siyangense]|uniref:glycoside hydrolase domain-containing protein n=1 Tax=Sphingobacterium siyangense TaxID=459529 RepID=UPI003DA51E45